jgi:hypothetical protein
MIELDYVRGGTQTNNFSPRRMKAMKQLRIVCALLMCMVWVTPVISQEASSKSMELVRDAAKSNKKALIAVNLGLTPAEEKGFWPLYDSYQAELDKITERVGKLIVDYAKEYNADSLSDAKAKQLMKEYLACEEDVIKLKKSYLSKFDAVIPGKKVMTYYQLENKIGAIIRYDAAQEIPLALQ